MSESLKAKIARRPLLAGALAALGFAAAGGVAYEAGLFAPSYPETPYDDLLRIVPERTNAIAVGKAAIAQHGTFDIGKTATALREKIGNMPLADAIARDIERNDLIEVQGWVLPVTLAGLCALAAKAG